MEKFNVDRRLGRNGGHGENVLLRAAVGKTIQLCKESTIITI